MYWIYVFLDTIDMIVSTSPNHATETRHLRKHKCRKHVTRADALNFHFSHVKYRHPSCETWQCLIIILLVKQAYYLCYPAAGEYKYIILYTYLCPTWQCRRDLSVHARTRALTHCTLHIHVVVVVSHRVSVSTTYMYVCIICVHGVSLEWWCARRRLLQCVLLRMGNPAKRVKNWFVRVFSLRIFTRCLKKRPCFSVQMYIPVPTTPAIRTRVRHGSGPCTTDDCPQ